MYGGDGFLYPHDLLVRPGVNATVVRRRWCFRKFSADKSLVHIQQEQILAPVKRVVRNASSHVPPPAYEGMEKVEAPRPSGRHRSDILLAACALSTARGRKAE